MILKSRIRETLNFLCVRLVAPIPKRTEAYRKGSNFILKIKSCVTRQVSHVTCPSHLSCVTFCILCFTCHLYTKISRSMQILAILYFTRSPQSTKSGVSKRGQADRQTDIATYRLNRPRGLWANSVKMCNF